MKHFNLFMVMMALLSMTSCNNNGSKTDNISAQDGTEIASEPKTFDPFVSFAENK